MPQLPLRYNIAPTQLAPVIRADSPIGNPSGAHGGRRLHMLRWGLIPTWADDPKIGNRLINARSETAPDKPAFRSAFKRRRCLVPADAFFEWQKTEDGRKLPHAIRKKDGSLFAFAGLWETWRDPATNKDIETFTILTTEPNEVTRPLHNRMPVIVSVEDYDRWLDPQLQEPEDLLDVLKPADARYMEAYAVSARVNNPANDDVRCLEREEIPVSRNSIKQQRAMKPPQPSLFNFGGTENDA